MFIIQIVLLAICSGLLATCFWNNNKIIAFVCIAIAQVFFCSSWFYFGQMTMEWQAIRKGYGHQKIIVTFCGRTESVFEWDIPLASCSDLLTKQNPDSTQIEASDTITLPEMIVYPISN